MPEGIVAKLRQAEVLVGQGRPALKMSRLLNIKTLAGFDFIDRHEVVHVLGRPGRGKTHLAIGLAVEG
ncbi:ATP-binding protein [Neoroseomonas soli]|uniref:ATP-binding protein n=1 Tax=Neoroseomonas soli TaxID=1081025 RepID=A0A9X9WR53_9PROT|nr:ATP-binding protein [Neoroseomonas soli]MBR0669632.1 ATP-binding protein [Neoroseomonas soli]